jgi:phage FluMu protein Com
MTEKKEPNIKCDKCDYAWNTGSVMIYVSCPRCKKSVNIEKNKIMPTMSLHSTEDRLRVDLDYQKSIRQLCEERGIDEETAKLIFRAFDIILAVAKKG